MIELDCLFSFIYYNGLIVLLLLHRLLFWTVQGTLEDDKKVLYKTKSLDGTKPNTNPKTNSPCEHTGRNGQIHVKFNARRAQNVPFSARK